MDLNEFLLANNVTIQCVSWDQTYKNLENVIGKHVWICDFRLNKDIVIPLLENPNVESITVIEKNPDVIKLVYPHLKSDKLTVINADIFEWKPEKTAKYDSIYFDIWTFITTDSLPDIKKLHNKFKNKLNRENVNCWMDSWQYGELKYRRQQEKKTSYW